MIVPRSQVKEGFMDIDKDDFTKDGYFKRMQEIQLKIIKDSWVSGKEAQGRYK